MLKGLTVNMFSSEGATIFSGLMSMIGGALGALGAFLVARYQVKKEREVQVITKITQELPTYMAMKLELEKLLPQIEILVKNLGPGPLGVIKLDAIIWERWESINKISDPVLLEELLKYHESVRRNLEVFEYDLDNSNDPILEYTQVDKEEYRVQLPNLLIKTGLLYQAIKNKIDMIHQIIEGKLNVNDYEFISSRESLKINAKK